MRKQAILSLIGVVFMKLTSVLFLFIKTHVLLLSRDENLIFFHLLVIEMHVVEENEKKLFINITY